MEMGPRPKPAMPAEGSVTETREQPKARLGKILAEKWMESERRMPEVEPEP